MTPGSFICFGIGVMICQPLEPAQTPVPAPSSTYCDISKPLYYSPKDTRKTKENIDVHNAAWKRLCRPPVPTS